MSGNWTGSMRGAIAFFVAGMAWCAGAQASSFVTIAPPKTALSASMIELGAPASSAAADPDVVTAPEAAADTPKDNAGLPPGEIRLSPSVIALGEPEVTPEKVAAIGHEPRAARRNSTPMVIRGGVAGDAFSSGVAATTVAQPQAAEQKPGTTQPGTTQPAPAEPPKTANSDAQQPAAPPQPEPQVSKPE